MRYNRRRGRYPGRGVYHHFIVKLSVVKVVIHNYRG